MASSQANEPVKEHGRTGPVSYRRQPREVNFSCLSFASRILHRYIVLPEHISPDLNLTSGPIMLILNKPVTVAELKALAENSFGELVKAVVDVDRELIALDAELSSDLQALLLDDGSAQASLWGINFYPDLTGEDFVEFDSMINVRPSRGNLSRGVEDENVRRKIILVSNKWVNP